MLFRSDQVAVLKTSYAGIELRLKIGNRRGIRVLAEELGIQFARRRKQASGFLCLQQERFDIGE